MLSTEDLIRAAVHKFGARRGEATVFVGGRRVTVHKPGEKVLHLPNGQVVKVTTDDSGCATQVEEDESLHAIARPRPIRLYTPGGTRP
jgi:hypothetical protein